MIVFDDIINRRGYSCAKWDFVNSNRLLPLTCADMDFMSSPAIMEGIQRISKHGIYGYTLVNDVLGSSVKRWYQAKHDWTIDEEWVVFCPRVLQGVNVIIPILTDENDGILIFSPWYDHLAQAIDNNNRKRVEYRLDKDNDRYYIDFDRLEKVIIEEKVKVMLFNNPHNPVGRVWKETELIQLVHICKANNVLIISDDIHSDIVYEGSKYCPLGKYEDIKEQLVIFNSPAKTFNVAGLHTSYAIIPSQKIRGNFAKALKKLMIHAPNIFAIDAIKNAYLHSDEWYSQLMHYLADNLTYIETFLEEHIPRLKLIKPEGTYLAWLDYSSLTSNEDKLKGWLLNDCEVMLSLGSEFGEWGRGYVRLNYACPQSTLKEALDRISNNIEKLLEE